MRNHHHLTCKTVPPPPDTHTLFTIVFLVFKCRRGKCTYGCSWFNKVPVWRQRRASQLESSEHGEPKEGKKNVYSTSLLNSIEYSDFVLQKIKKVIWYLYCKLCYLFLPSVVGLQEQDDLSITSPVGTLPVKKYTLFYTLSFVHLWHNLFVFFILLNLPDVGFYLSQGSIAAAKIDEKFLTLVGFLYNRKSGNQTSAACHTSLSISSVRSHTSTPVGVWRS